VRSSSSNYCPQVCLLTPYSSARNEALIALDFVSLLISKDAPKQADLTMSPHLKQFIKPGTLAMDVWHNVPPNKEQEKVDDTIALGWGMQSLQASADSLLGAATRLEKNVRKETHYWEQVLSVSDKGWSISRLPREKHNLGVRFGFLEALGEFRDRGLAALRSDEDGNVLLDKGFGNNSKVLRVRIQKGDQIVGVSHMPDVSVESESTLEARIRHARDSLYEEELFHEIIRESRSLASYGVDMRESTIRLPTQLSSPASSTNSEAHEVLIDLLPLTEIKTKSQKKQSEDVWAQAIALALRLFLSYTHRERLIHRSGLPPPMSSARKETPVASIMKPVLTLLQHRSVLGDIGAYLGHIKKLLDAASVDNSVETAAFDPALLRSAETIDTLMQRGLTPLHSRMKLSLKMAHLAEALDFGIEVRTSISQHAFGSAMLVTSPIGLSRVEIPDMEELKDYLNTAIANALGHGIVNKLSNWSLNDRCGILAKANSNDKISIEVCGDEDAAQDSLVLRTPKERIEWKVEDDEMKQNGFWDTVKQRIWDGA
jgi:mediator of RNA polymerase II transcription subunit 17